MRIKILRTPPVHGIDGIRLDCFEVGRQYEVGNSIGALFLAEGWAEPVPVDAERPYQFFTSDDPFDSRALYDDPPNLKKEQFPPYLEPDVAADLKLRRRRRRR
jgi:hypothetical protein